jgi:hypothetical protein
LMRRWVEIEGRFVMCGGGDGDRWWWWL